MVFENKNRKVKNKIRKVNIHHLLSDEQTRVCVENGKKFSKLYRHVNLTIQKIVLYPTIYHNLVRKPEQYVEL